MHGQQNIKFEKGILTGFLPVCDTTHNATTLFTLFWLRCYLEHPNTEYNLARAGDSMYSSNEY
jgi:hypothetical protein